MEKATAVDRFLLAQGGKYDIAFDEIKKGRKESHWMWFIFPQIAGLGKSPTSVYYSLRDLAEAMDILGNRTTSTRLRNITKIVVDNKKAKDIRDVFPGFDAHKFHSCMTLFSYIDPREADGEPSVFTKALNRFYNGEPDIRTLKILKEEKLKVQENHSIVQGFKHHILKK